jgi:hypothetical protein
VGAVIAAVGLLVVLDEETLSGENVVAVFVRASPVILLFMRVVLVLLPVIALLERLLARRAEIECLDFGGLRMNSWHRLRRSIDGRRLDGDPQVL